METNVTPDLNGRELVAVVPMVVFMIWIGIQPMNFLKTSEGTMNKMSDDLLKMKQGSVTASKPKVGGVQYQAQNLVGSGVK